MRDPILFAGTFVVILAAFSSGCASSKAKQPEEAEAKPALRAMGGNVGDEVVPSNESIGFEIRRRLNEEPSATAGIIVEVDEGKVTLRGMAPNLAASWRAEAAARSVKGVKQVMNQIIVAGTPRLTH